MSGFTVGMWRLLSADVSHNDRYSRGTERCSMKSCLEKLLPNPLNVTSVCGFPLFHNHVTKNTGHNPSCDPVVNVMVSAAEPDTLGSGCSSSGIVSSKRRCHFLIMSNRKDVHAPKHTAVVIVLFLLLKMWCVYLSPCLLPVWVWLDFSHPL